MKETVVETKKKIWDIAKNYSLRLLFLKTMYFFSGILLSRGSLFGHYYPFGISFSASAPGKFIVPATAGAILGYLAPLGLASGVRYICTLIAIVAVKWALSDLKKINNGDFYIPLVVFIPSLMTGIAINCAVEMSAQSIWISVFESLIAAMAARFFDRSYKIFFHRAKCGFGVGDLVYIAMSWSLVLLSLNDMCFSGVSIGRCAAIFTVLVTSYLFGVVGGTIFGTSLGIGFSISSFGFSYISGVYSFGAIICGLFSKRGKIAMSSAFLIANIIISMQSGDTSKVVAGAYESLLAIFVFLLLPKKFFERFRAKFLDYFDFAQEGKFKEAFIQKLNFASKSLICIPQVMDKISKNRPDISKNYMVNYCENRVKNMCGSCCQREYCYGCCKEETSKNLNLLINQAQSGCDLDENLFSESFRLRCSKSKKIVSDFKEIQKKYISQKFEIAKMDDIRKAAGQQLCGVSEFLGDILSEIDDYENCDPNLCSKIKNEFNCQKIDIYNMSCKKDKNGNMFMEFEIPCSYKNMIDSKLCKRLEKTCKKKFEPPVFVGLGESLKVQMCETTKYKVKISVAQHNCGGANVCGDSCKFFEDGLGNFNVILSDGMGTGSLASIEGETTSELMKSFIKAGMGFDCAIKLVNSSLVLKSKDELLSTLDVMSVNLFSGKTKFMKAGAPATFILRGNDIIKLEISSLPMGIFSDAIASTEEYDLREDDKVIMLSDGVTDLDENWLKNLLSGMENLTVNQISNKIVQSAVELRKNLSDDDITSVVMCIEKNK